MNKSTQMKFKFLLISIIYLTIGSLIEAKGQSISKLKRKIDSLEKKISELEHEADSLFKLPFFDLTDIDGDGVIDSIDQEKDTPDSAPVDTKGISLDSDSDGLIDYIDKEPFSPIGFQIDKSTGIAQVPKTVFVTEADVHRIVGAIIHKKNYEEQEASGSSSNLVNEFKITEFPIDNYPIPVASGTFSEKFFANLKTMKDVSTKLQLQIKMTLENEHYPNIFRYFMLPKGYDGFALALTPELLANDIGEIKAPRIWGNLSVPTSEKGFFALFNSIFVSAKSNYRIIVFVVSNKAATPSSSDPNSSFTLRISQGGIIGSIPELAKQKVDLNTQGIILVYQVEVSQYNSPTGSNVKLINPKTISGEQHLKYAKLLEAISH
jgi:hypothetical protein